MKISIIGAGHMGSALYAGLKKGGAKVTLGERGKNRAAAKSADVVILAVKPSVVADVLAEIADEIQGKAVVSSAAALSLAYLKKHAKGARVARIMPNIPVAIGEGVLGLYSGTLSSSEKIHLRKVFAGLGALIDAKSDREIDALTLISGCGPGIVAYLIESLAKEASALGLKGFKAEQVAFQTFMGTAAYMSKNMTSAAKMRASVATKGGVTETIVSALDKGGFRRSLKKSLVAGAKRIGKIRK